MAEYNRVVPHYNLRCAFILLILLIQVEHQFVFVLFLFFLANDSPPINIIRQKLLEFSWNSLPTLQVSCALSGRKNQLCSQSSLLFHKDTVNPCFNNPLITDIGYSGRIFSPIPGSHHLPDPIPDSQGASASSPTERGHSARITQRVSISGEYRELTSGPFLRLIQSVETPSPCVISL